MNPQLNAVLSSIRSLLMVLGTVLAAHGLAASGLYFWVQLAAGSVMVVGPAIWGVYTSIENYRRARATGVQAGINLVTSGKAITEDGSVVSKLDGTTPPKAVTLATADQIIKDFAPAQPIAKA